MMIGSSRLRTWIAHAALVLGILVVAFPIYYTFIASSLVKEVARHGGDVDGLVPKHVLAALDEAYGH